MKKANILKIASAFVLVAAMLIFCACGKDYLLFRYQAL